MFIYVGSVVDPNVFWASRIHNYGTDPDLDPDPARYTFQLEVIWIQTACSPKNNKFLYLGRHFLVMPKNQAKMKTMLISN